MTRALSFRDVQAAMTRVPDLAGAVLVGGQALNHWAGHFGISRYGQALSFDIDFLGGGALAEDVARALGGEARIAGMTDPHTPNTALVTVAIGGEDHHIDFLGALHGFSGTELQRVRDWAVVVKPDAGGPGIAVMHPVHCLRSVLANTYGEKLNRRAGPAGSRAADRVRLAVTACRCITLEYLEHGRDRDALRIAETVHTMSLEGPAMRANHDDGIEIIEAIPIERMPTTFIEKRWPRMEQTFERAKAKHKKLVVRRAELAAKRSKRSNR